MGPIFRSQHYYKPLHFLSSKWKFPKTRTKSCGYWSHIKWKSATAAVCTSCRALKEKKYLFRDIHNFSFSAKIQDGRQKWQKLNFSPRHRILLYYPVGQKFARNSSISYLFEDIFNVLFSAKIQDGCQKWRKLNFFPFA